MPPIDWYQQTLTPPDAIEVRIRLGFVAETDHLQVLVEAFDPLTGAQVAQASLPHRRIAQWPAVLQWAVSKADEYVRDCVEPFT